MITEMVTTVASTSILISYFSDYSTIWRVAQDLIDVMRPVLPERADVLAGPVPEGRPARIPIREPGGTVGTFAGKACLPLTAF